MSFRKKHLPIAFFCRVYVDKSDRSALSCWFFNYIYSDAPDDAVNKRNFSFNFLMA